MKSSSVAAVVQPAGDPVARQHEVFERRFGGSDLARWSFHDTPDPLVRYLRDRRLEIGVDRVLDRTRSQAAQWDALVVCGGVGGEGSYLARRGFGDVTVSDFSESALDICRARDPRLRTLNLDAERLALEDESFDLVLVQDGLHHLGRPALGLTEMLRVARRAVVVVEPHAGIVGRTIGTEWERHGPTVNYVYRWNRMMIRQTVASYLLERPVEIDVIRLWDHNVVMGRVARAFGGGRLGLAAVKAAYATLDAVARPLGNMMIAVILKDPPSGRDEA